MERKLTSTIMIIMIEKALFVDRVLCGFNTGQWERQRLWNFVSGGHAV